MREWSYEQAAMDRMVPRLPLAGVGPDPVEPCDLAAHRPAVRAVADAEAGVAVSNPASEANPAEVLRSWAEEWAAVNGYEVDQEAFDRAFEWLAQPVDPSAVYLDVTDIDGPCYVKLHEVR